MYITALDIAIGQAVNNVFEVDLSGRQQELDGIVAKLAKPKKQRHLSAKKRGMEAEVRLSDVYLCVCLYLYCSENVTIVSERNRFIMMQLPLIIPRQVVNRSTMLCQVEDEALDLKGVCVCPVLMMSVQLQQLTCRMYDAFVN